MGEKQVWEGNQELGSGTNVVSSPAGSAQMCYFHLKRMGLGGQFYILSPLETDCLSNLMLTL